MAVSVPVKIMLASVLPSPCVNVSPAIDPSVSEPTDAESEIWRVPSRHRRPRQRRQRQAAQVQDAARRWFEKAEEYSPARH